MQAEGVDYQRLPLECFFCYFFLRAEDCAESYFRRDTEPLPKERLNTSIDTSKKNINIKTHPANQVAG